jgi:O-methyltransferase
MKKLIKYFLNFLGYKIIKKNSIDEYSIDLNEDENQLIKIAKKFSMTNEERMAALTKAIQYIIENNIEGDFVECGVWKGGNLILMQNLLELHKIDNKKIYGYDTFEGMSEPNKFDINIDNEEALELLDKEKKIENNDKKNIWCYSGYEYVLKSFNENTNINYLNLVKGDVAFTLKKKENLPKKISLLRLDTDFYESTKIELEELYPLLSKNGILIIDDYGHWKGARKAVDEYFRKKKLFPLLNKVDYSCRLMIKK